MRKSSVVSTSCLLLLLCLASSLVANAQPQYIVQIPGKGVDVSYPVEKERLLVPGTQPVEASIFALVKPPFQAHRVMDVRKTLPLDDNFLVEKPVWADRSYDFTLGDGLSLDEFSAIRFRWRQANSSFLPYIAIKGVFSNGVQSRTVKGVYSLARLKYLQEYDLTTARYEDKGVGYLVKRELGLADTSDTWKVSTDSQTGQAVLQRRIDVPANIISTVRIMHSPECVPSAVHFSVDTNGDGGRDIFIHDNPQTRRTYADGPDNVLEIDVGRLISEAGIGISKAVILEPIIFLPAKIREVVARKALRGLYVMGHDSVEKIHFEPTLTDDDGMRVLDFHLAEIRVADDDIPPFVELRQVRALPLRSLTVDMSVMGPDMLWIEPVQIGEVTVKDMPSILDQSATCLKEFGVKWPPTFNPGGFHPLARLWQWRDDEGGAHKSLWVGTSGVRKGRLLIGFETPHEITSPAWIDYSVNGKPGEGLTVFSPSGEDAIGGLPRDATITGLRTSVKDLTVSLFDVEALTPESDLAELTWWQRKGAIPLVPEPTAEVCWDDSHGLLHLLARKGGKQVWRIELHANPAEYLPPASVFFPGGLPPLVSTKVIVGERAFVTGTTNEVPLSGIDGKIESIVLELTYDGPAWLISFPAPKLRFAALRNSIKTLSEEIRVLIGRGHIYLRSGVPTTRRQYSSTATLSIPAGQHSLGALANGNMADVSRIVFKGNFALPDPPLQLQHRSVWWSLAALMGILVICFGTVVLVLRSIDRISLAILECSYVVGKGVFKKRLLPFWGVAAFGLFKVAQAVRREEVVSVLLVNLAALCGLAFLIGLLKMLRRSAVPHVDGEPIRENELGESLLTVGMAALVLLVVFSAMDLTRVTELLAYVTYQAIFLGILLRACRTVVDGSASRDH